MPKDLANYLDIWGNMQTTELRAFVEGLDTALTARYKQPNKWKTADLDALPDDEREELRYRNPDGGFAARDDFPRLGRHVAFVGIVAFFEHKLFSLRERCRKIQAVSLDVKKNQWGADEAKKCFKKELDISLAQNNAAWERLLTYVHIRNLVVHGDSRVPDFKDLTSERYEKFERSVQLTQPIDVNSVGQFTLSREYCLKSIDHIESYFQDDLLPLLP